MGENTVFREHHKWKYWREREKQFTENDKQMQQEWLWEDRKVDKTYIFLHIFNGLKLYFNIVLII